MGRGEVYIGLWLASLKKETIWKTVVGGRILLIWISRKINGEMD
jgi:hypothetical protein